MIKRILSVVLGFAVIWLMIPCQAAFARAPVISAEIIRAAAGDTAELRLMIQDNPGIISLGLDLQYDTDKLKLTDCQNGEIFPDVCMTAGNDHQANPYSILWDDAGASDYQKNGTLAVLKFEVSPDAHGISEIQLRLRSSSTVNSGLHPVSFVMQNGAVQITEKGILTAGTVFANGAEQVRVPVSISHNPGIAALRFSVEYDAEQLRLTKIEDTGLLGEAVFSSGKNLSEQPYYIFWDDIGTTDHTENGILAWLTFDILKPEADQNAPIRLTLDPASTINSDLKKFSLDTRDGCVITGSGPSLMITQTSAKRGEQAEVAVVISEHSGLAGLAFDLSYDPKVLQLQQAENGEAFPNAVVTFGNNLKAVPYSMMWEDSRTQNMTGSGTIATLRFLVSENTDETFTPITAVLRQSSTFNEDLQSVPFEIADGGILIEPDTTTTTTGTTTATTETTTSTTETTTTETTTSITETTTTETSTSTTETTTTETSTSTTESTTTETTTSTTESTTTETTTSTTETTTTETSTSTTETTTTETTTSTTETTTTETSTSTTETTTTETTTSTTETTTTETTTSTTETTTTETTTSTTETTTTETTTSTTETTTTETTTSTTETTTTETTTSTTETTTTETTTSTTETTTTETTTFTTTTGTTTSTTETTTFTTTTGTTTSTTETTTFTTTTGTTTSTTETTTFTTTTGTTTSTTETTTFTITTDTTTSTTETTTSTITTDTTTSITTTDTITSTTETTTTTTDTTSATTTETTTDLPDPVSGDFNRDKELTVADAVLFARYLAEDLTLTESEIDNILNAKPDQDEDNLITIHDLTTLLKKLGTE